MSDRSLKDWLTWLETLHPKEIELGLDRVRTVAENLGLLPVKTTVITVAGTNGKGSCVAAIEHILLAQGNTLGCYTSPHLLRYNERVRINGQEASDALLCTAFETIEAQRGDTSLTYFEYSTLAALWVFAQQTLDVVVLEVGLGGRLDAVNIVDPTVAVITSIDIDHSDWLGEDRETIALEKAGILRQGKPFICGDLTPPDSLVKQATDLDCESHYLGQDYYWLQAENGWVWEGCQESGEPLIYDELPASHLLQNNIAAAIQALVLVGFRPTVETLRTVLAKLTLPGRIERRVQDEVEYILDVAHNPAAVAKLAEFLSNNPPASGRTACVFSVMADKDIRAMISQLVDYIQPWFIAELPKVERAARLDDMADVLRELNVQMVSNNKNPKQAFRRAQSLMGPGDRMVVCGSFYTVAEAQAALDKDARAFNTKKEES